MKVTHIRVDQSLTEINWCTNLISNWSRAAAGDMEIHDVFEKYYFSTYIKISFPWRLQTLDRPHRHHLHRLGPNSRKTCAKKVQKCIIKFSISTVNII